MSQSNHIITVLTPQGESVVSFQYGENLRDILLSGNFFVRSACGGNGACGRCQVGISESNSLPFTNVERLRLSGEQLRNAVRLACQIYPVGDLHVSVEQPVVHMSWRPLREDEYSSLHTSITPQETEPYYGVAIDLGTTHIRLTLWDLATGKRIAGRTGLNPQDSYGADILTRVMEASRSSEAAWQISSLVQRAIAEALLDIATQASLKLSDVNKVLVVGNTAMLSLLAGKNFMQLLQPENWTHVIDCQPDDTNFMRNLWGISRNASIRLITPLGGFIGSDLLAGVMATRLTEQSAGSLLIDFGTNSEIALWDGRRLHATSAAGGPAFEGSGISCGMPGEAGAIYGVDQVGEHGFIIRVLGEQEPTGLCGSGLIDAVAWLLRNGKLDKVGRFVKRDSTGFVLHEGRNRIVLKPGDIDVLQRAKAAIGGGIHWLCRQAGMSISDLQKVYVCGAFGRFLNVSNAQQIGLLPSVPIAAVRLESNTALAGCETWLLSAESTKNLDDILALCNVYNLADKFEFESLFVDNLYLQPMQELNTFDMRNH